MSYMSEREGMLDWVARGCERLMQSGGGPLPREQNPACAYRKPRTTPEQVAEVVRLAKAGKMTAKQIGEAVGLTPAVVRHAVYYRGISIPYDRNFK